MEYFYTGALTIVTETCVVVKKVFTGIPELRKIHPTVIGPSSGM